MVGSFAEFERAIIRERTQAWPVAARARGRIGVAAQARPAAAGRHRRHGPRRTASPRRTRRDSSAYIRPRSVACSRAHRQQTAPTRLSGGCLNARLRKGRGRRMGPDARGSSSASHAGQGPPPRVSEIERTSMPINGPIDKASAPRSPRRGTFLFSRGGPCAHRTRSLSNDAEASHRHVCKGLLAGIAARHRRQGRSATWGAAWRTLTVGQGRACPSRSTYLLCVRLDASAAASF